MFQARRPTGRLFYWLFAMVATASSLSGTVRARTRTEDPARNPAAVKSPAGSSAPQSGPALTSVIEVRENDYGWGQANDRNLLGRFSSQTFTLARLAAAQSYFLRLYDNSSPPNYSRYSAALHVDYPQ